MNERASLTGSALRGLSSALLSPSVARKTMTSRDLSRLFSTMSIAASNAPDKSVSPAGWRIVSISCSQSFFDCTKLYDYSADHTV